MSAAAYLEADAAALGDFELPRAAPRRPLSDTALHELEYAASLFRRVDKVVSSELDALRGIDVPIDFAAAQALCTSLLRMAVVVHIRAQREREARGGLQ